jgi:hypothetical protein
MAKKENHMGFMSKLLSFGSDKDLKRYYKIVDQINGLEPQFEKMTEEELRGQTDKFRERYANGESLDDMLPEAFATVREASKRTMGMRHFDVQLIGAMALHEGHIAEAKARPWSPRWPATSTLLPARVYTSLPSTITWPSATPSGWAASTSTWE